MKFQNVAIYTPGEFMGNFNRIDAKEVEIIPTEYAQYREAFKIVFKQPRKRLARYFFSYKNKPVYILPLSDAVPAQSMFKPAVTSASGLEVNEGKFLSFSPEWEVEFLKTIEGKPILFSFNPKREAIA